MIKLNNFAGNNENIEVIEQVGPYKIIRHLEDLSVEPATADEAYFMYQMQCNRKQVIISMNGTPIRLAAGAMQMAIGEVSCQSTGIKQSGGFLKSVGKSMLTGNAVVKPIWAGVGMLITEPTYRHYLIESLEEWGGTIVCDDGMFVACDANIKENVVRRNTASSALFSGEGLFNACLTGNGYVVLQSPYPRQELYEIIMDSDNDVVKIDGNHAVCWSGSLTFTTETVTKGLLSSGMTGEGFVNVFRGKGKILVAPVRGTISDSGVYNISASSVTVNHTK